MSADIIQFGAKPPPKARKPKRRNSHKQTEEPAAERPFSTQTLLRHAQPLPTWLAERNKRLEKAVTCTIGAKTYKVTFDDGKPYEVFSICHRTLWGRPNSYYREIKAMSPQSILDLAAAERYRMRSAKGAGNATDVPAASVPASSEEATVGQLVDAYLALDPADRRRVWAILSALTSVAPRRAD